MNTPELTFFAVTEVKITRGYASDRGPLGPYYTRQIVVVNADGSEFQINLHTEGGQKTLPVIASDEEVA